MDLLLIGALIVLAFIAGWQCCVAAFQRHISKEYDACMATIAQSKTLLKNTEENNNESRAILERLKGTASKG